jgi:hypothetical protein
MDVPPNRGNSQACDWSNGPESVDMEVLRGSFHQRAARTNQQDCGHVLIYLKHFIIVKHEVIKIQSDNLN